LVGNNAISKEREMTTTTSQCWTDLDLALQAGIDRVLLYGQPGTGKTFYALNNHLRMADHLTPTGYKDRRAYRVLCSPDMTTADIDGLWKPSKEDWKFVTGSALRAWEGGDRLILDELDQASGDVLTALLLICDSDGSAVREHPETGERISPKKGFEIIATTNAERLEDLPANLVDRFPVRININEVNPQALLGLPEWLQPIAKSYANRTHDRYSLRSFFAFDKLTGKVGHETATRLIFGTEAKAILEAVRISTALGSAETAVGAGVVRYDLTSTTTEMGE
jgi:MoxR-like ATPase